MPTTKPRLFVTRRLPLDAADYLGPSFEVDVSDDALSSAEIGVRGRGAQGLVCLVSERIDASVMDAIGELQVIANYAVGVDNIDLNAAVERGIVVCNTPDVLTAATADFTWMLILAAARRAVEGESMIRQKAFSGWAPTMLLGQGLDGKRLGVFGFGRIGQAVARRARGFDMEVVYCARSDKGIEWASRVNKQELIATSDVIAVCCPLNPETHHAFGAREFAAMKSSAVIVNTGRGPIVDEAALADALGSGQIFGAGLDVFEEEPLVHPKLLQQARAVLMPHLGSATIQARQAMAKLALGGAKAVLSGMPPVHRVV